MWSLEHFFNKKKVQRSFWIKVWAFCVPTIKWCHVTSILSLFWAVVLFFLKKGYYYTELHRYKMTAFRKSYFNSLSVITNLDEDEQCRLFKCFTNYFHMSPWIFLMCQVISALHLLFYLICRQLNEEASPSYNPHLQMRKPCHSEAVSRPQIICGRYETWSQPREFQTKLAPLNRYSVVPS